MPLRVFLSHASADTRAAEELARCLQEGDEIECFLDRFEIGFGENVVSRISDGLAKSDYVLLLLSPNSLKSRWVEQEWTSIYSSELLAGKTRLMPVLLEGATAPAILRDKKHFALRSGDLKGMRQIRTALLHAGPILLSLVSGPEFVGREPELNELKERLSVPGSLLSVIGMPGVGKTYLAREFVRRHGVLFEGVYELRCSARDLAALSGDLASILGFRLEGEVDQVTSELRRHLSAKRTLLVLDDVVDDQPSKLVPGGRSSVLVTARTEAIPFLTNSPRLTLSPFTEREALEFFQRTLGDVPKEQSRELLRKLGYLPMAVAFVAALIKRDVRYSVRSLLAALSEVDDSTHAPNTVAIVLRNAIAALDSGAGNLLMAFAACAGEDIELAFAGEIAALSVPAALEALQTLYSRSLIIEVDRASRRYRLHPLVRQAISPTPEVRQRHAVCVLQQLKDSDRDPLKSPGLIAEARHAMRALSGDPELSVYIATEAGNLSYALGRMGEALEFHAQVEDLGTRERRNDWIQAALGNQTLILRAWGRFEEAMALLKKQEAISLELGDRTRLQRTYGNQALILRAWGRLEEAMALLKKQEAIALELGDRTGLQRTYGNQALILQSWGRLEEAMALHKREEAICEELGDRVGLQATCSNQALILKAWGRLEEAMALLKKQEAISAELGDRVGLHHTYSNQALILKDWGRLEEAMALLKKQEAICQELADLSGLQESYGNQAVILQALGDLEAAMLLHKREERICRELGDRAGLAASLGNQAAIMRARGSLDEALELLREQETISRELGDKAGLAYCYWAWGVIARDRGEYAAAKEKLGEASSIFGDLRMDAQRRAVLEVSTLS